MADGSVRTGIKRSKRTPRIIAAYAFLRNISLDGNAIDDGEGEDDGTELLSVSTVTGAEDDDEVNELLTNLEKVGENATRVIHHSISVTCTGQSEKENKAGKLHRIDELCLSECPHEIARTKSLVETSSSCSQKDSSKLSYLSSPTLFKQSERYLNSRRIVLVTSQRVPCGIFSVVPYSKENKPGIDNKRGSTAQQIINSTLKIEGIEIGEGKRVVSYSHLLVPVARGRVHMESCTSEEGEDDQFSSVTSPREGGDPMPEHSYDPLMLDDPELTSRKHRTVLQLPSLMSSIFPYAKPSEIKRDINSKFQERFPNIQITLTKLRSVKAEMADVGLKCSMDPATVACAHVYFEKLVLMGKITKGNRKYCAGACLLLAAKFHDDLRKSMINPLIEGTAERFRLHVKELLACELQVLVCLEFSLCVTAAEVLPAFKRIITDPV